MTGETYYSTQIRHEIERRIAKNPRYSLRAFAKAVGVSAGNLSGILTGKKSLSTKTVEKFLEQLELSPEERRAFVASVLKTKATLRRKPASLIALESKLRLQSRSEDANGPLKNLDRDTFSVISEWYHYAILELCETKGFRVEPAAIAHRFGISIFEATTAWNRLTQMGLIENHRGKPRKSHKSLSTQDLSKTTVWHRKRQKQILEKSIWSLENDPIENRCHRSLTLPISLTQISLLKSKIEEFIWEIASLSESTPSEEVYELHVGLIPLSKNTPPHRKRKKI